ncbi:hypothetical protein Tco_0784806 [Tanacetum coccineum]
MGNITDIKSVLTQKALRIFCETFLIPDEVNPELPSPNQIIHEMPTGKIGVYTRFFEYANFRLPLSTFLVNVLKHYRIHISQLSVIAAAKVSHFEIMCRVHGFEPTVGLFRCFYVNSKNKGWMSFSKRQGNDTICYTKPLDSLKGWNDHFFWVDAFACLASFPWNTSKSVSKDPFPKSSEFNAEHYATLVAYSALFHKYPKSFLCLVGMSRHYTLDKNTYPEFLHDNDQLMVPIHHSPDQTVVSATALSLALDVSSSRVRRIKDNIVNHRSALRDVFIPLAKPFSSAVLMGTKGTSGIIPGITIALSTTFASASLIPLISTDDYEIVSADDQAVAGRNNNPFPNVDDA